MGGKVNNKMNNIQSFYKDYDAAKERLMKNGNAKPTTEEIIAAMKKFSGNANNAITGYTIEHQEDRPTTKYMPPVKQEDKPTTKYMPPVKQDDKPTTKYMPPVKQDDQPTTRYMPPIRPQSDN